ncbi:MAG TPA: alkaline phosphatase family protein [Vicinamibacteria bacterium]
MRPGRSLACALVFLAVAPRLFAAPPRRTENVILITTDGLRWQELFGGAEEPLLSKDAGVADVEALRREFWRDTPRERRRALLPFFWSVVAKQGQVFGNRGLDSSARVTNGHNFSYPGYNELLSGRADPRVDSNDKKPNPNVTVLEWLNGREAYRGRVAAFGSWDVFPWIINRERSGVLVNAGFEPVEAPGERMALLNELIAETTPPEDSVRHDSFTFLAALEHLRRAQPRVLYLALGETDDWAHAGRYDRYLLSARRFDRYLRRLWDAVQSLPQYRDQTSIVITTDHGRGDAASQAWKGHGAKVPGAEHIWIAVLGPDTAPRGERSQAGPVTQSQVAATVAALLGEDFAGAMTGVAPPIADVLPGAR